MSKIAPVSMIDLHDSLSDDMIDLIHDKISKVEDFKKMYNDKYPNIMRIYLDAIQSITEAAEYRDDLIRYHDDASDQIMMIICSGNPSNY